MKFKDALKRSTEMLQSPAFERRARGEDPTMLAHVPLLVEINRAGFLTNESQAGRKFRTESGWEVHERAYVTGFMLKPTAEAFIKNMGVYTDKNAVHVAGAGTWDDFPGSLGTPLTVQIKGGKVDVHTKLATGIPQSTLDAYLKEAGVNKTEGAVFVVCWDPKWNRGAAGVRGLFTDVLAVLKGRCGGL
jgi:hypothetical protein